VVAHSRAAARAHRLRPLNQARPIRVETDESGEPVAVVLERERLAVADVQDRWRIDDEWWCKEVSRLYFEFALEDGRTLTIYRDLVTGRWSQQNYA
jgi:hypothetical protein